VEWIPDPQDPDDEWPMLLRRNDEALLKTYNEFWDKVWWNRHQAWRARVEAGEQLSDVDRELYERAEEKAAEIAEQYGRDELVLDEFEWGMLNGRMSALAWVLGSEWNGSLDT
jgi:hypothetical protein